MTYLLKVTAIATTMAVVGAVLISLVPIFAGNPALAIWSYLPKFVIASIVIWLPTSLYFRHRIVPLKYALELGAASPFLGAVIFGLMQPLLPFSSISPARGLLRNALTYLIAALAGFWLLIPIGVATAYLVHRQTRKAGLA